MFLGWYPVADCIHSTRSGCQERGSAWTDLPPVMGPLLVREFSGWAPWNQSSFPAVSRRMTSVTAWSATTVRKRAFSSSRALSRFR